MRFTRKSRKVWKNCFTKVSVLLVGVLAFVKISASSYTMLFFSSGPTPLNNRLWAGEKVSKNSMNIKLDALQIIELVVAYCQADLQWLEQAIANELPKQSKLKITFLSKCGNHEDIPAFENHHVEILQLPNKGGCDLAFARFLREYMERENAKTAANSVIFFLKDTPRVSKNCHQGGRYRTIDEMLQISSHGEFICGVKLNCGMSAFHDTRLLKQFVKESYVRHGDSSESNTDFNTGGYETMNAFITRELNWSFPNEDVTEVCYGGSFAVPASRLFEDHRLKEVFIRIEKILLEGPSMSVVEHFSERLWASWLAKPLNKKQTKAMKRLRRSIITENGRYMGTLASDKIDQC